MVWVTRRCAELVGSGVTQKWAGIKAPPTDLLVNV